MNSLSSGYATSAYRSVSGAGGRTPSEEPSIDRTSSVQPVTSKPNTLRKNRIVAPPPAQYVSELPAKEKGGGDTRPSSRSSEPRAKMVYAYQANGEGEITVEEGKEVVIMEPDGNDTQPAQARNTRN